MEAAQGQKKVKQNKKTENKHNKAWIKTNIPTSISITLLKIAIFNINY